MIVERETEREEREVEGTLLFRSTLPALWALKLILKFIHEFYNVEIPLSLNTSDIHSHFVNSLNAVMSVDLIRVCWAWSSGIDLGFYYLGTTNMGKL